MYRVSYTAYLPDTVSLTRSSTSSSGRDRSSINNQLDDYSNRLYKQSEKLENLNYDVEKSLAKCKRYYDDAQKREARLKESLTQTKKAIRSKSSTIEPVKTYTKKSSTFRSKYNPDIGSRYSSTRSYLDY